MVFKILLALFSIGAVAQPRINQDQLFLKAYAPTNYVLNSNAWYNLADVVDADGIVTRQTTGALEGRASFQIDATASDEEVLFEIGDLPQALLGQACEADFKYKGDATNLEAFVRQGSTGSISDVVPLLNASSSQSFRVVVPCGSDNTDTRYIVLKSNGATTGVLVDSLYFGEVKSVGEVAQAYDFGSLTYPLATSCVWSNTNDSTTTPAAFSAVTACATPTVTGNVTAPSTKIPAFVIPAGSPSGIYQINVTGAFFSERASTQSSSIFGFFDGANNFSIQNVGMSAAASGATTGRSISNSLLGSYNYVSSSTDTVISIRGANTQSSSSPVTGISANSSFSVAGLSPLTFNVTYLPTSSQIVQRGDVSDLTGFAKTLTTANCDWLTTSATMASFSADADCPIPTVSGNAASPATKIPAFVAPKILPGKYMVVASGLFGGNQSTSGTQTCNFEIWDGTSSGGIQRTATQASTGASYVTTLSGSFEYSATQSNIQFQIRAQRTGGNSECVVGASANGFTLTLIPLSQGLPRPFIPSSVFAGRSNVVKVGSARLTCSTTSSIPLNPDGMVSAIGNRSGAECSVTFASGYFSDTPQCTASARTTTGPRVVHMVMSSATSGSIYNWDGSTGTNTSSDIICIGNN
jgi:hypothetical protein